jgi:hypothetical protein
MSSDDVYQLSKRLQEIRRVWREWNLTSCWRTYPLSCIEFSSTDTPPACCLQQRKTSGISANCCPWPTGSNTEVATEWQRRRCCSLRAGTWGSGAKEERPGGEREAAAEEGWEEARRRRPRHGETSGTNASSTVWLGWGVGPRRACGGLAAAAAPRPGLPAPLAR